MPGTRKYSGRYRGVYGGLCMVWLLLCGCKTAPKNIQVPPGLAVAAVAVYPFGFRWGEKPFRSTELSQRLVREALTTYADQALFFGPSEFHVYRIHDDNAWAATDLLALLPAYSVRPERALILRPWAEKRVQSVQREAYSATGRGSGQETLEETTYVGHVELVHPSSQHVVAELSAQVVADPFAPRDDFDPDPALTMLMESLTREALQAVAAQLAPPTTPWALPFKFAFNPHFDTTGLDAVDAELFKLHRVKIANPGLSDADAARLMRMPPGLWVTIATPSSAVRPGELLLSPAVPQALHRARFASDPERARIRQNDGTETERLLRP